jgi:AsmA protein
VGKLLKIFLSFIVVALGLVVVLVVALLFIVDPNDYKGQIASAVEEQTGRSLTIEGDMALSVFPWLGLDIGKTQLSNAAGFGEEPMARMDAVQVRVKLLPLLRKDLVMDTVRLSGLQLNLARAADGSTNWDDLTGTPAEDKDKDKDEAAPTDDAGAELLGGLAIGGVEVTGAQLVWDDRSTDSHYEVRDLSFTTGAIEPGEPFDLDLGFSIAATQPDVSGSFDLTGGIWIDESLQALRISDARFVADVSGEAIPGGQQVLSLASDIALDLQQQTLELPQLVLNVLGMEISGQASGSGISGDAPQFRGDVAIAEFIPREVITALGQDAPVTSDATVLGKADASLQWEASAEHFAATSLTAHLDDTRLGGMARLDNFAAPAIGFDLQVDAIDVDRYLPPPSDTAEAAPATPAAAAGGSAGMLPVETLRGLNLDGSLKLGSLKAYNLRSTNIEFRVRAKEGLVRIHPAGALMYQGQYTGDITIDARRDTPDIAMHERMAGIQAGPLLKDLIGDDKMLGKGDLTAKLTASGNTPEAMKRTLNGNLSFAFTEGAVKGVNIAALIRNAQAKLQGKPAPAGSEPDQTDFAELRGTAKVTNGVIKNKDLSLKSPLLRMSGKGKVGLPDESIDYELTTKIVGSLEGQGGKALQELKGVAIPIRIGGTFSEPTWTPDLGAAVGDTVKKKARKEIEKKSRDLLKDKLDDQLLKGLFK